MGVYPRQRKIGRGSSFRKVSPIRERSLHAARLFTAIPSCELFFRNLINRLYKRTWLDLYNFISASPTGLAPVSHRFPPILRSKLNFLCLRCPSFVKRRKATIAAALGKRIRKGWEAEVGGGRSTRGRKMEGDGEQEWCGTNVEEKVEGGRRAEEGEGGGGWGREGRGRERKGKQK